LSFKIPYCDSLIFPLVYPSSKHIDVATGNYIKNPEIKTIQEFNSSGIPTIGTLLREFRLYLADLDIKIKDERRRLERRQQQLQNSNNSNHYVFQTNSIPKSYLWIESRLLQTAIPDHRKYTVELLLAPYLINIKHLPAGYAYSLTKHWTSKCNALRRLEPSSEYFDNKINKQFTTKWHTSNQKRELADKISRLV
jgi:hypothetical protein